MSAETYCCYYASYRRPLFHPAIASVSVPSPSSLGYILCCSQIFSFMVISTRISYEPGHYFLDAFCPNLNQSTKKFVELVYRYENVRGSADDTK
eukprot:scaffold65947_cov36-Attheya_sp.AAC.2